VRLKLHEHLDERINVMARVGQQQFMSWSPGKKAVVLLDLCREGHSECLTDHMWSTDTTLLSLAESTVLIFSGVVKAYQKGYFRYAKKMDYTLVNIQVVQIIHSTEYVISNFSQ
jgi:hypothetical protein